MSSPEHLERPSVRLCWFLVGLGGLAFVVLAAVLVPWQWVPGGHLEQVSAQSLLSDQQIARAEAYSSAQRHLGWASYALSLLIALVLGFTRVGAALVSWMPRPWWLRALVGTLAVVLVGALATVPFQLQARGNAVDAGLTRQPLSGWWRDWVVSLGLSWVFAAALVLLVLISARRSPRRWPVWVAGMGVALTYLGSFFYPVVVEPLFNSFKPLPAGELRTGILELARKEHVHISDVLVADASRRTTTLNAYVSGFGDTRRVVLYDTLVKDVPERETLVVVAHELGHAHYDDVLVGTSLAALGVVAGSGLLGLLLGSRRLARRAGLDASVPGVSAAQPEVVALLLALSATGSLLVSPVQNTISRAVEARADRASLSATGDTEGFVKMQVALSTRSLSDPTPPAWSQFWFGSHPTMLQRVGMARALAHTP